MCVILHIVTTMLYCLYLCYVEFLTTIIDNPKCELILFITSLNTMNSWMEIVFSYMSPLILVYTLFVV